MPPFSSFLSDKKHCLLDFVLNCDTRFGIKDFSVQNYQLNNRWWWWLLYWKHDVLNGGRMYTFRRARFYTGVKCSSRLIGEKMIIWVNLWMCDAVIGIFSFICTFMCTYICILNYFNIALWYSIIGSTIWEVNFNIILYFVYCCRFKLLKSSYPTMCI